jgi:hypothetical protein
MKVILSFLFCLFAMSIPAFANSANVSLIKAPKAQAFHLINVALADEPAPAVSPSPSASPDGVDKVGSYVDAASDSLKSHESTILQVLSFLGSLLFMKLFPNSKAGPIIGSAQKIWDKVFLLMPKLGRLVSLLFEFLYALVKSDGVGGAK